MSYKCYRSGAVPEPIGASVRQRILRYQWLDDTVVSPLLGLVLVFSLVYLPVVTARIALHHFHSVPMQCGLWGFMHPSLR